MKFPEIGGKSLSPAAGWTVFAVSLTTVLAFLGFRNGSPTTALILIVACGLLVAFMVGIDRLIKNPTARAFLLKHMWAILLLYVIGQIALFVWDHMAKK